VFEGRFKQSVPPLILGHEGGGMVEEVGPGVHRIKKGDRSSWKPCCSAASATTAWWAATTCASTTRCWDDRLAGGIRGILRRPEKNCHVLSPKISWEEAGLIDTLAGPVHGVTSIDVPLRGSVAVFGPGPAGLFFCRLLKIRGAGQVYLIGTRMIAWPSARATARPHPERQPEDAVAGS